MNPDGGASCDTSDEDAEMILIQEGRPFPTIHRTFPITDHYGALYLKRTAHVLDISIPLPGVSLGNYGRQNMVSQMSALYFRLSHINISHASACPSLGPTGQILALW